MSGGIVALNFQNDGRNNNGNLSQLDSLIEGQEPEFAARVLRIVRETGLRPNDPLFMILVSTSTLKLLLEDAPKELQATYNYCNREILKNLAAYESAAAQGTEKKIAAAVESLIKKTQGTQARVTVLSALPVGLMFLITLMLGALGGLAFSRWQANQIAQDPAGLRQLTLDQANALNWALTKEGQLAKKLMDWNDNLANRRCEKEIKELGIAYRLGNKQAVSGFCTIWVAPPSSRRFVKFKDKN